MTKLLIQMVIIISITMKTIAIPIINYTIIIIILIIILIFNKIALIQIKNNYLRILIVVAVMVSMCLIFHLIINKKCQNPRNKNNLTT